MSAATEIDRPTTAERMLSREQISEIDDVEWLENELDRVVAAATQIEVDLEFRSDDFATEEWEHRARKALTAHHICQGHLNRRLQALRNATKVKGPSPADHQNAKARKREAEAARLLAAAENKRLKAAHERETTVRQMIAFADRQTFLATFYRVARRHLEKEVFGAWVAEARAELEETLVASLPAQRIEARSDETPQESRPLGQEPDPKGCAQ